MILNAGVFALGFRLAVRGVPMRSLLPGACLAAVGWQVLQLLGGLIVTRTIARASPVYGFFTLVIVLLDLAGAVRPDRPAGDGGGLGAGEPAVAARPGAAGADPR